MAIKLKSVLKIPRQQLQLIVRATLFTIALWLFADRNFSVLQLGAFIVIGSVLYFTPVFHTLLLLPSFLVLMTIAPIALSVFGIQVSKPFILAAIFGLLFYLIIGIKQIVIANRVRLHHALHLALVYISSLLFFAAPGGSWFIGRSLGLALILFLLIREFFLIRGAASGPMLRLISAVFSFLIIQAVWAVSLLPIGFINSAGVVLVFLFILEELILARLLGSLSRRKVITEISTFAVLVLIVLGFSTWTLPH